jgi:hypothetical protein
MDEQQVTAIATRLKLRNWLQLRRFFRVVRAVELQLEDTPDLISYSRAANFLRLRFFTLSVWKDDHAVDAFVGTGAHREAMAVFDEIAIRDESGFVRWKAANSQEIAWEEARKRLAEV